MKQLKVGIAGYGLVGKHRRKCIDSNQNLKLVAVCDKTLPKSGIFEDGIRYYDHYHGLLNEELDILFVCLTNDVAPKVTIAGLNKGINVFCEKPPGRNLEDISKVIACEKNHPNLKLMYGFNHRYHYSVREALNIVYSGELGKVINLRAVYGKSKLITFNQPDWRTKREIAGGGILLDQGIHIVDLIRLFAGEFNEVYSFISNNHWKYNVEDNAYAIMRTQHGVVAMLHSSATQWRHRFELDITLEKGSIILGGILSTSKSYGAETLRIAWASDDDVGDPKEQVTRYNRDPPWDDEIKYFVKSILIDSPIINSSSMEAYKTMELVYKIYC